MVQPESEDEEEKEEPDEEELKRQQEEEEERKRQEEEEAAAAAAEAAKKGGKAAPAKKGGQPDTPEVDPEMPDENDPNKMKFIPDVIHFDKAKHQSTEAFDNIVRYQMFLKPEEQFGLIYDDCTYDTKQGEIVDFAFANGLSYLNLKGIGKPQRSCKVDRFQEILEELRRL